MSTTHEASFWPKPEDELDLHSLLEKVIVEARESRRVPSRELATVLVKRMGEELAASGQHHHETERSRASKMFSKVFEWITSDWEIIDRSMRFSREQITELGIKELSPAAQGSLLRHRRLSVRLLAAMFVVRPDLFQGRSLRALSLSFGVTPALISNEVKAFNKEFGVRGRGQKSEQACLSYAIAQEGNQNRRNKSETTKKNETNS